MFDCVYFSTSIKFSRKLPLAMRSCSSLPYLETYICIYDVVTMIFCVHLSGPSFFSSFDKPVLSIFVCFLPLTCLSFSKKKNPFCTIFSVTDIFLALTLKPNTGDSLPKNKLYSNTVVFWEFLKVRTSVPEEVLEVLLTNR